MVALVVDDSRVARRLVSGILREQCGISEIVEAGDGKQALDIVSANEFDLIMLDWNMPKMQGIDVLRAIRGTGNRTPIIMVTSEMEKARVMEAVGAGANNYVIKPFHVDTFVEKVTKTLERFRELSARRNTRKALVADDSRVSRRVLSGILRDLCEFKTIVEAQDGLEALEQIKKSSFDVVLLDWNMPGMQGIDVLREMRSLGKRAPVIMVTGEEQGSHVIEAFDAGVNNYIIKPFEPATLAEKINQVLRIQG